MTRCFLWWFVLWESLYYEAEIKSQIVKKNENDLEYFTIIHGAFGDRSLTIFKGENKNENENINNQVIFIAQLDDETEDVGSPLCRRVLLYISK